MSVQDEALKRALAFLKASGAQYKVVLGKQVHDTFPPEPAPPAWRHKAVLWRHAKLTGYIAAIRALQPGEQYTLVRADYEYLADPRAWNSQASAFLNCCRKTFNADTFVYENDSGKSVTVLRVE